MFWRQVSLVEAFTIDNKLRLLEWFIAWIFALFVRDADLVLNIDVTKVVDEDFITRWLFDPI